MQNTTFQIKPSNLAETQLITQDLPTLQSGQVLLKIERFALTANNITYGVIGDQLGYWRFFPAADDWGMIPVWGFAKVVASAHEGVKEGERFYGYYPMAEYLIADAGKVSPYGFRDIAEHRLSLPVLYNNYSNVSQEKAYEGSSENMQMIFRPLFTTSFLLDDLLLTNQDFGAEQIILTSASSKTAFSLAFLLHNRSERNFKIVGLTSARNVDFVRGLACYDEVIAYDDIKDVTVKSSAIIDFAGNKPLLLDLQEQLGEFLKFLSMVGLVHHDQREGEGKIKGTFFFAPTYLQERLKEWGGVGFQQRIGKAWQAFTQVGSDWLEMNEVAGLSALDDTYQAVLDGSADAKVGQIIVL